MEVRTVEAHFGGLVRVSGSAILASWRKITGLLRISAAQKSVRVAIEGTSYGNHGIRCTEL